MEAFFVVAFVLLAAAAAALLSAWYRRRMRVAHFPWPDARVLITGASSGIGAALAHELAARGARVCICARRAGELGRVAEECRKARRQWSLSSSSSSSSASGARAREPDDGRFGVHAVVADVAVQRDCARVVAEAVAALGGLDIVVLNAGIAQSGFFADATDEDLAALRRMLDINTLGAISVTSYALPHLVAEEASRAGAPKRVFFVSSLCGLVGVPTFSVYCATKWALHGFAEALRLELAMRAQPVAVGLVCPGLVATDIDRTRIAIGGVNVPLRKEIAIPVERAAQRLAWAIAAGVRLDTWMPLVRLGPLFRAFAPALGDFLTIRQAQKEVDADISAMHPAVRAAQSASATKPGERAKTA